MEMHGILKIDGDRWAKHPYRLKIYDEDNKLLYDTGDMDSREECLEKADGRSVDGDEIINAYNIPIEEIFC